MHDRLCDMGTKQSTRKSLDFHIASAWRECGQVSYLMTKYLPNSGK